MTRTIQFSSSVVLNETGRNSDKNKREVVEDIRQLLTLFDGLNNLREELSKLDYVPKRKKEAKH